MSIPPRLEDAQARRIVTDLWNRVCPGEPLPKYDSIQTPLRASPSGYLNLIVVRAGHRLAKAKWVYPWVDESGNTNVGPGGIVDPHKYTSSLPIAPETVEQVLDIVKKASPDVGILHYLARHEKSKVSDIVKALGRNRNTVYQRVEWLEFASLIKVSPGKKKASKIHSRQCWIVCDQVKPALERLLDAEDLEPYLL